jgi:hypothetical protein
MKQCRSWWILDSPALLYFLLGYYYYSLPGQDSMLHRFPFEEMACFNEILAHHHAIHARSQQKDPVEPIWSTSHWVPQLPPLFCGHVGGSLTLNILYIIFSDASIYSSWCCHVFPFFDSSSTWDHPQKNPWGNAQQGSAAAAEEHPEPWPELVAVTSRYPHCYKML